METLALFTLNEQSARAAHSFRTDENGDSVAEDRRRRVRTVARNSFNLKTFSADIRFSLRSSVESVKDKLWRKCGTSVDSMSLHLYDDANTQVSILDDNSKPLGFYSPHDGYRLHVIDLDPSSVTSGGWLEDTSLVEKYTISQEAYEKRDGTFRKFKDKLASQNPSTFENKIPENYMEDLRVNIKELRAFLVFQIFLIFVN
ncbi:hypothetical protein Pyn_15071 [Prunus yedoensis var. nudiflora]|uniref:Ubiquitin-like domain-containing protein n=1 Tax=Prunus yedoensis var. nudiflora TaxID=2094558 RepID=A0A314ZWG5_PRUYE|nr:hypothetical protein Pyn_15071 [Prunus yedoensis var. nudiflora]